MKSIIWICFFLTVYSCTKDSHIPFVDKPSGCDSARFTYSKDIKPIIINNCILPACHATGGNAGYDYNRYEVLADRVRSGRLENRIDLPDTDPMHMPKSADLQDCDYYKIKTWIHQGFPEN